MEYPQLVIISDGRRVAALLDGVFYGKGVQRFTVDATEGNAPEITLSIDKINAGAFRGEDVSAFEAAWKDFIKE